MENNETKLDAANQNIDITLNEISEQLKHGETLVLEVGYGNHDQTDKIYDTLVMKGFNVKKTTRNGKNMIIVNRAPDTV